MSRDPVIQLAERFDREGPKQDKLRLERLDEFVQRPSCATFIRGLVPQQSIVVVFGPPKGGKTFAICDLTMHAAHGMPWHGFKPSRALKVAYLAGEGTNGLKVRLRAWLEHHDNIEAAGEFRVLPRALSLPEYLAQVIEVLQPFAPEILVVDTLNAYFGPRDENSTPDMTAFCDALRQIRDTIGCSIICIHHTGHGNQERERGSIVLRASADVLIQVAKDENGSGNVGFQLVAARDLEPMTEAIGLKLRHVETSWKDDDGETMDTCIVEGADDPVSLPGRGGKPLGHAQQAVLDAARKLASQSTPDAKGMVFLVRSDVAAIAKEQGASRQSIHSAWQPLAARKLIHLIEPGSLSIQVRP